MTGSLNWLTQENCFSSDLAVFNQRLLQLTAQRHYAVIELGKAGNDPIRLITPQIANTGPHLLAAAVFHGEEPAGGWGILRFLETISDEVLKKVDFSFLPMVNPSGFRQARRLNDWGENPNKGFIHSDVYPYKPSREGQILLNHLPLLKSLGAQGVITLHEDNEFNTFYLYTFEKSDRPGLFSKMLYEAEACFFDPAPDGQIEEAVVKDGIIFNACAGTFEDLMFHEGITHTATTETPGLLNINLRVEANKNILFALVAFGLKFSLND